MESQFVESIESGKLSPMMRQYLEVKERYHNCIVFFRIGDFYEMFFDDAVVASRDLDLTLTGKDCGLPERAPMCGVPYHACEMYLKKLLDKGHIVAICEQLEDPATTKGLVMRDVVRVVTPGTLIESSMLDEARNNYLCCIYAADKSCASSTCCAVCFVDISTGAAHMFCFSGKDIPASVIDELSCYSPAEVLANEAGFSIEGVSSFISDKLKAVMTKVEESSFESAENVKKAVGQFSASCFEDIGLESGSAEAKCATALFSYIADSHRAVVGRFSAIYSHQSDQVMNIGFTARRNLELTETLRSKEKKGSLLWVLDKTKTSMGKRLLKSYIEQPLINPAKIIRRLDAVEELYNSTVALGEISAELSGVYDLERLMTRVMYKTATARDLKALSLTALKLPAIKETLGTFTSKLIAELNSKISPLDAISSLIENAIEDEPPANLKDGGVIKDGFNKQLDGLRDIISGGRDIIAGIESREKEATGIKNLKIGYNRVFGYYIEVTRSYYSLVPDRYIRKQTLTNCERFITEELKDAENTIIGANDKSLSLESEIFTEIRDFVATQLKEVQQTASALACLDVLCSFAQTALSNGYVKPQIFADGVIHILGGRHPVVEQMQKEELFVPNDCYLDTKDNRMMIITGPNMSGKSTYMRQVALITLMAQMGSFVPAQMAQISVVDKIFTRVGASDDLTSGQSTFMVEMSEVAEIVRHATRNSLVILDEVGRGTSTFDGISIARAVCEYICRSRSLGCKTLFATHYHELICLEKELKGVKNYSVSVARSRDSIKFLRSVLPGGVDESYGIEVAKLAGLPEKIITRARELLAQMESESPATEKKTVKTSENDDGDSQMSLQRIADAVVINKLRGTRVSELNDEELRSFVNGLYQYL